MIAVKTTETGIIIDFKSTMFMHEMFLLKTTEDKKLLQKYVEEKNSKEIFKLVVEKLGIGIFYFI